VAGGADVHGRAFADGFHSAKNFDRIGGVIAVGSVAVFQFCLAGCSRVDLFRSHSVREPVFSLAFPEKARKGESTRAHLTMPRKRVKLLKLRILRGISGYVEV